MPVLSVQPEAVVQVSPKSKSPTVRAPSRVTVGAEARPSVLKSAATPAPLAIVLFCQLLAVVQGPAEAVFVKGSRLKTWTVAVAVLPRWWP